MTTGQQNKKVAIVVADGFEQVELTVPKKALEDAGFTTEIVSPVSGSKVQGFNHSDKADEFPVDVPISRARPDAYVGLLLPGGVHNPDQLRQDDKVLAFVRHFFETNKPVAAICHGPWTLIDAGVAAGRRLTSWPSLKTDLRNAGATWVNEQVVVDKGLVTSRGPQDLPAFCKKLLEELTEGPQRGVDEEAMLAKLGDLIKDIKVAVLTTTGPAGTLHSRPMATVGRGRRFDGTLWFFTSKASEKNQEVASDREVSVSYSDPKSGRYVTLSGKGRVVEDRSKAEELWSPIMKAWFPGGLSDPELSLLRIDVERAEIWESPAGGVGVFLGIAKALLTGKRYRGEGAQHETIELEATRADAQPERGAEPQGSPAKSSAATSQAAGGEVAAEPAPDDDEGEQEPAEAESGSGEEGESKAEKPRAAKPRTKARARRSK